MDDYFVGVTQVTNVTEKNHYGNIINHPINYNMDFIGPTLENIKYNKCIELYVKYNQ